MKKLFLVIFVLFLNFNVGAFAAKLPSDVAKYVKTNLPNAKIRFDSVIVLPNDIMYIPLYPPTDMTVESLKVEYSYPSSKSLKDMPEVLLLNNGYSFLKVFKDEKGNYTLTKKDDLPIKVRLGLMPQDMLTPVGLKMPESLKLTLGDLLIPSKEETTLAFKDNEIQEKINPYNPAVSRNEFIPVVQLKDKKTFINPKNSKFISVYDNTSKDPLHELKLSAMPIKILTSSNVALVIYWSGKEADIIDLKDERLISKIELDGNATDAALNEKDNIAYITSQNANSIYVVSLNSMQLVTVVKLDQKPSKIVYCQLDDSIAFFDEFASKVFNITRNGSDYIVQPIGSAQNITKVLSDVANIYAISRTNNNLSIFDKNQGILLNTIELDKKPTDAIMIGTKIFILCSKEGYMNVYDTVENKIISKEQLSKDGFYSKMTLIPNDNNIIITGMNAKNYLIYDFNKMKLVKKQDSYIDVNNIVVIDKNPVSERL